MSLEALLSLPSPLTSLSLSLSLSLSYKSNLDDDLKVALLVAQRDRRVVAIHRMAVNLKNYPFTTQKLTSFQSTVYSLNGENGTLGEYSNPQAQAIKDYRSLKRQTTKYNKLPQHVIASVVRSPSRGTASDWEW